MKHLLQSTKIVLLALLIALSTNYVMAWIGPTASAPDNNLAAPVNVSVYDQAKSIGTCLNSDCGGLSVGTFNAVKAAEFDDITYFDDSNFITTHNTDKIIKIGRLLPVVNRILNVYSDANFLNAGSEKANVLIGAGTADADVGLTIDLSNRSGLGRTRGILIRSDSSQNESNIVINKQFFGVWSQTNNNWADGNLNNLTLDRLKQSLNTDAPYVGGKEHVCVDTNGKLVLCFNSISVSIAQTGYSAAANFPCPETSEHFTLGATFTGGSSNPITYQWKKSTDGGATWVSVGTNSAAYTTEWISVYDPDTESPITYSYKVNGKQDGVDHWSNIWSITQHKQSDLDPDNDNQLCPE